ncbi:hypothetical protein K469DRAFT_684717 [Zopfia rhizophila CBS 207.26]|uniref:Uncharacterized protein n=1 Tax=Zopfia rhizophila CBS 207.26 TaxID=1314779 RepID=A0A6A6E9T2_9PEZI|nr:hypothetical protein K469DRAFT_684717 [Zopfia rhizophila CBS 207.26]
MCAWRTSSRYFRTEFKTPLEPETRTTSTHLWTFSIYWTQLASSSIRSIGLYLRVIRTASRNEIFRELAVKLIEHTGSLRVLSAVWHSAENALLQEYTSWIPIWNRRYTYTISVLQYELAFFGASAGYPGSWSLLERKNILHICGFTFDRIDEHTNTVELIPGRRVAGSDIIDQ